MQGEARKWRAGSFRNANHLFGVWVGDHSTVQADPGQAGAVPFVLSKAASQAGSAAAATSGS